MTRETKIGLLVGLGFIVVFAVLLSHTGSVPPPGENITSALSQKTQPTNPVLSGDMRTEIGRPEPVPPAVEEPRVPGSGPEADPAHGPMEERVVSLDSLPELLPAPRLLDPSATPAVAAAGEQRDVEMSRPIAILSHRTAPPLPEVVEPMPNAPHDPPSESPAPDAPKALVDAGGNKTAPPLNPPKEYVVQSKDNLVKIARKHYQNSDQKLIQFLVDANEGRIKDADTIVEGQKLLIPDLPPEMFERAPGFDVRLASGRAVSMEDLLNDAARKAPAAASPSGRKPDAQLPTGGKSAPKASTDSKVDLSPAPAPSPKVSPGAGEAKPAPAAGSDEKSAPRLSLSGLVPVRPTATDTSKNSRNTGTPKSGKTTEETSRRIVKADQTPRNAKADGGKGDQLYRWYEIKPNDTLGSIASKELGSSQHWQQIKKLNGGIDPQRMKPGERIKLPRKPVSSSSPKARTSA